MSTQVQHDKRVEIPQLGINFGDLVADAAFNTTTAPCNQVEARTGLFNAHYPIARLIGNNGLGPHINLALFYSPTTSNYAGIGDGWSLPFSVYNIASKRLWLGSGEMLDYDEAEGTLEAPGITIEPHTPDAQNVGLLLTYKNGQREVLMPASTESAVMLCRSITAANGHTCTLEWDEPSVRDDQGTPYLLSTPNDDFELAFQNLKAIRNTDNSVLFSATYNSASAEFKVWPGTDEELNYELTIDRNYCLSGVKSPDLEQHTFGYTKLADAGYLLTHFDNTAGLTEWVTYATSACAIVGEAGTPLPVVTEHGLRLSPSQEPIVTSYAYATTPAGGFTTTATQQGRQTIHTYDQHRSLLQQQTVENDHSITVTHGYTDQETATPLVQSSTVFSRPLLDDTEVEAHPGKNKLERTESILNEYDLHGNIVKNVQGNVTTQWEYYSEDEKTFSGPLEIDFSCADDKAAMYPKKEWATHTCEAGHSTLLYTRYMGYTATAGMRVMQLEKMLTVRGSRHSLLSNSYCSDASNRGRLKYTTTCLLDEDGLPIALSTYTVSYVYVLKGKTLATTLHHSNDDGTTAQWQTAETVSTLSGRLIEQTDANGNTSTFAYDGTGRLSKHTRNSNRPGFTNIATYSYPQDKAGRRTVITQDGVSRAITTDTSNQPLTEQLLTATGYKKARDGALEASGKRWFTVHSTEYDPLGREYRRNVHDVLPDGTLVHEYEEYRYDNWNQRCAAVSNHGRPAYRAYDPVTNTVTECANDTLAKAHRVTQLDASARVISIGHFPENSTPFHTTFTYGPVKDWSDACNALMPTRVLTQDMDSAGELRETEHLFKYDDFDRVVCEKVTPPAGQTSGGTYTLAYEYPEHLTGDQPSRITCSFTRADGTLAVQELGARTFDSVGRVKLLIRGDRVEHSTYAGVNPNPITRTVGTDKGQPTVGVTTRFTYSPELNNAVNKTVTNEIPSYHSYAYGATRHATLASEGAHFDVTFNELNQPTIESRSPKSQTSHSRNYTYSVNGRVATEDNGFGVKLAHTYNGTGDPIATTAGGLDIKRVFGWSGELESETLTDSVCAGVYTWSRAVDENGVEHTRTFNDGLNAAITLITSRDTLGRISGMTQWSGIEEVGKKQYTYNANGSLSTAVHTGAFALALAGATSATLTYRFDALGNLTSVKTNTAIATYVYDRKCGVQMLNADGQALSYHTTGHLHTGVSRTFTLSSDKQQIGAMAQTAGPQTSFTYDPDRTLTQTMTRSGASVQTLNLVYRHGRMAGHYVSSTDRNGFARQVDLVNTSSGMIVQRTTEGDKVSTLVLFLDMNGSVIYTHDASTGTLHPHYYTPFGHQPLREQDPVCRQSILGFNGEHVLGETQLYPLAERLYDPAMRQFLSQDSWSPFGNGGLNAYHYCQGDPINLHDPSGHATLLNSRDPIVRRGLVEGFSFVADGVAWSWNHSLFGWASNKLAEDYPIVSAVVWGVIGVGMALFTGGTSLFFAAAMIGAAIVGAGLGIASACLAESDPELSAKLGWASLGACVTSGLASMGKNIQRLAVQLSRSTRGVVQHVAARAGMVAARAGRNAPGSLKALRALSESLADQSMDWMQRSAQSAARGSVREAMRKFSAPDVAEVLFGAVSGACSCSDVGNEEVQKAADSVFNATWLPLQYGGWKQVGRNARLAANRARNRTGSFTLHR